MVKVRIELVPDFGPRKGQVLTGIVVDADYASLLKAVQNKLQLKKKDINLVTLHRADFSGFCSLPEGDLSAFLFDGAKVVICQGAPAEASQQDGPRISKRVQQAVNQTQFISSGTGSLSGRGRPNPETLFALKVQKGLTGVVTLLEHDEAMCAARSIGETCERLGLKWCHAPLGGPKKTGMIGRQAVKLTPEDMDSLRKIRQVKEWLQTGDEKIVVHCAAGLHRTGIFLYLLLRELGEPSDRALEQIRQIRQPTFDEFTRLELQCKTEAIFAHVGSHTVANATADMPEISIAERSSTETIVDEEEEDEE